MNRFVSSFSVDIIIAAYKQVRLSPNFSPLSELVILDWFSTVETNFLWHDTGYTGRVEKFKSSLLENCILLSSVDCLENLKPGNLVRFSGKDFRLLTLLMCGELVSSVIWAAAALWMMVYRSRFHCPWRRLIDCISTWSSAIYQGSGVKYSSYSGASLWPRNTNVVD